MPYMPQTWVDGVIGGTPITAAKLTYIENGVAAASSGGVATLTPTVVKTNNYTATANDFVLVNTTASSWTVTFPAAPADMTRVGVKQVVRGGTNVVNLALGGSDSFNIVGGPTTGTITLLNQAATFQYIAATAVWVTVASDTPLTQLDTRYATQPFATSRAVALAIVLGS